MFKILSMLYVDRQYAANTITQLTRINIDIIFQVVGNIQVAHPIIPCCIMDAVITWMDLVVIALLVSNVGPNSLWLSLLIGSQTKPIIGRSLITAAFGRVIPFETMEWLTRRVIPLVYSSMAQSWVNAVAQIKLVAAHVS
jgi:hypothetical protein